LKAVLSLLPQAVNPVIGIVVHISNQPGLRDGAC
jgi:hypothetical protein